MLWEGLSLIQKSLKEINNDYGSTKKVPIIKEILIKYKLSSLNIDQMISTNGKKKNLVCLEWWRVMS